tara:strand:- start:314 stop:1390 length:1077 start_codon:yes stop_codon:yes gene_type:complete
MDDGAGVRKADLDGWYQRDVDDRQWFETHGRLHEFEPPAEHKLKADRLTTKRARENRQSRNATSKGAVRRAEKAEKDGSGVGVLAHAGQDGSGVGVLAHAGQKRVRSEVEDGSVHTPTSDATSETYDGPLGGDGGGQRAAEPRWHRITLCDESADLRSVARLLEYAKTLKEGTHLQHFDADSPVQLDDLRRLCSLVEKKGYSGESVDVPVHNNVRRGAHERWLRAIAEELGAKLIGMVCGDASRYNIVNPSYLVTQPGATRQAAHTDMPESHATWTILVALTKRDFYFVNADGPDTLVRLQANEALLFPSHLCHRGAGLRKHERGAAFAVHMYAGIGLSQQDVIEQHSCLGHSVAWAP